jgi:signal peptidase I
MPSDTAEYPYARARRTQNEPVRRTPGRGKVARVVSSTLLGAVVLLILVGTVGMVLGLWRFRVIDTGSMRPTLDPGDVAVLTSEPVTDLQRGQIVAFHPPGQPRLTVIHRVFSLHRTRQGPIIQTKGDANNATDPWRARIAGNTVWRENLKAPKLGYLAVWSQQRPVRMGVLIAIVILVVSMLLGWIWRPTSNAEDCPRHRGAE